MSLISWYRSNYQVWKKLQLMHPSVRNSGWWPSETYGKYPWDCSFDGKKVLNFGSGKTTYPAENVTNLDIYPHEGVDVVCKTNKLPFEDETFDLIIANHVIEHVPNWFESFKELARVVKTGGLIEVWIPPVSSDSAFTYRDHINRIGMHSFAGCKYIPRAGNNLDASVQFKKLGNVANLEIIQYAKRAIVKWWILLAWPSLLEFITTHLRNTVSEEKFLFRKVKHGTN